LILSREIGNSARKKAAGGQGYPLATPFEQKDFALCGERAGLCPCNPRFFEKNRVKLLKKFFLKFFCDFFTKKAQKNPPKEIFQ
jgi:hypothetical protein